MGADGQFVLEQIVEVLVGEQELAQIVLFGSYAYERPDHESDSDRLSTVQRTGTKESS